MIFKPTAIEDVIEIVPEVFGDYRGYFFESFHRQQFIDHGISAEFVQDNQSFSHRGVLRGLHFQKPPYTQGKLVSVANGSVLDVVVDLRTQSPTYGKHISIVISEKKQNRLWVPEGFAHGFLTLEDNTIFQYKCTNYYQKDSEATLQWNDPTLNINWNIENPLVSEKDKLGTPLAKLEKFF